MTLDIRGLPYIDAFKQVKDAVSSFHTHDEDVIVFVDSDELEKCTIIKGFVEILLECKTVIQETGGYYILKIMREFQVAGG